MNIVLLGWKSAAVDEYHTFQMKKTEKSVTRASRPLQATLKLVQQPTVGQGRPFWNFQTYFASFTSLFYQTNVLNFFYMSEKFMHYLRFEPSTSIG
jgi:hypothetical protein